MSNGWNLPEDKIEDAKRLLSLAMGEATQNEESLESFALLVHGLGAPEDWPDKVRTVAFSWIDKCVAKNEAPANRVAIIGKELALTNQPRLS